MIPVRMDLEGSEDENRDLIHQDVHADLAEVVPAADSTGLLSRTAAQMALPEMAHSDPSSNPQDILLMDRACQSLPVMAVSRNPS